MCALHRSGFFSRGWASYGCGGTEGACSYDGDLLTSKDALHAFMTGSRDLVSRHLDETDRLKQDSIAVQRAVESVSNDFDPRNPKVRV
jgi:hypothetical protein